MFRRKLSPDFIAVPVESSAVQQLAELRSRHDAALRAIDRLVGEACCPGTSDSLLEVRITLSPPLAVPVVPGPVDWENPR